MEAVQEVIPKGKEAPITQAKEESQAIQAKEGRILRVNELILTGRKGNIHPAAGEASTKEGDLGSPIQTHQTAPLPFLTLFQPELQYLSAVVLSFQPALLKLPLQRRSALRQ